MIGTTLHDTDTSMNILFAPAHTLIDEGRAGSDYYWAYKLIQRLALDHDVQITALTLQAQVTHSLPNVRFVPVHPDGTIPHSNVDSLLFHLRCYAKARDIIGSGQQFDVIHHMLPFGFRATFNLLSLLRHRTTPPLVVGPLQPPYPHRGGEEWQVQASYDGTRETLEPTKALSTRHRNMPPLSTLITTPILSALSAQTLRRATAVVAVSEQAARLYDAYAKVGGFSIIPPGVDTDEFYPSTLRKQAQAYGHEQPVTILACGRLVQRKAFDILLRAIRELIRGHAPVHLRLVGDGPLRTELEALAHALGIAHAVTFVGNVPHSAIAHEYRRADIFCSPSFGEGFATVALEALASGLPIVATPAGGFRDILGRHHVGILVPFGAVAELASALDTFVTSQILRETMSDRARTVAVNEYDWRVIARHYVSVYSHAIRIQGG